uniref:Uncharacterized protein n=1 Tax=Vitis vinifera TaxID=29760 RepID=F6GYR2_VITVI
MATPQSWTVLVS